MRKGTLSSDAPFGTLLGYAPGGVAIYSSDYGSLDPRSYPEDADFRSYIGNEYMGHKWQCVEFARRFLFLNYGFVFTDVGMAWEIFSLRFLREVVNDNILPLQAFANGSKRAPRAGALLIWQKGGEFHETGHVAVITGARPFRRLAEECGETMVIGGFTASLLLGALSRLVLEASKKKRGLWNEYPQVVREEGNERAKALLSEVFTPGDAVWRGIGKIPGSGLYISETYKALDAGSHGLTEDRMPAGCRCGQVLTGAVTPEECPCFGKACTPDHPVGACMVSSEGTCSITYRGG